MAWNFEKKETPAQEFFCDFCAIFLKILFTEKYPDDCSC